jgi:hypothetical protein
MALREVMRARLATAVPDFWTNPIIYLKAEEGGARLIAHGKGELGIMTFRQVLPDKLTPKSAHDLLISKNYRLKERFAEVNSEGTCDIYENACSVPAQAFLLGRRLFLSIQSPNWPYTNPAVKEAFIRVVSTPRLLMNC